MKQTLFEIEEKYQVLSNYIESEELDNDTKIQLEEQLKEIEGDYEQKIINISRYIRNLKIEKKNILELKNNLSNKEKSITRKIDFLTSFAYTSMKRNNKKKIKDIYGNILISRTKKIVEVIDESIIPAGYKQIKTEVKIDKNQIYKDITEKCIEVAGVELKENDCLKIT